MAPEHTQRSFNILIAEDNHVSRGLMVSILKTGGYQIFEAQDGGEAIDIMKDTVIDLAFVDINMSPKGGFEFIKHLVVTGNKTPVVIITAGTSADILLESNALGVKRLLQKPVEPKLLLQVARKVLEREGHYIDPLAVERHDVQLSHEDLMARAIDIARQSAEKGLGRPFGAVVADKNGTILGEGTNGITSQVDPTAHAEVMAIRQASEKLGRPDLSNCILYCSSTPTMIGQALIASVRIQNVYYALTHDDITAKREADDQCQPAQYTQIKRDEALSMFKTWEDGQK